MPETVWIVVIASLIGPAVLFGLNRAFGGHRKDTLSEWKDWSEEQRRRIDSLEERVTGLENALNDERAANKSLQDQNHRQASMLTALVRWAILLRDEVIRLGGHLPPAPVEVEAAMTNLEA